METVNKFINRWDCIISNLGMVRSEEVDEPFINSQAYKPIKGSDSVLNMDSLPEPYMGSPYSSSYVVMNLNPGDDVPELQNLDTGRFCKDGNAKEEYSKFAFEFPYLTSRYCNDNEPNRQSICRGNDWWNGRKSYFNRIANIPGSSIINPFALELCPWRSVSFGRIDVPKLVRSGYAGGLFDVASKASQESEVNVVFTVGKVYHEIFNFMKGSRFDCITQIDHHNIDGNWVHKSDGTRVQRSISLWRDRSCGIMYFNTFAPGSNQPPSRDFDPIIRHILSA